MCFPFPQNPDCTQYSEHSDAGSALPPVLWRVQRHPSLCSHTVLVREYLSIVANTLVLQNSAQATLVGICIILTCTQLLLLLLHLSLSLPPLPLIWKPQIVLFLVPVTYLPIKWGKRKVVSLSFKKKKQPTSFNENVSSKCTIA